MPRSIPDPLLVATALPRLVRLARLAGADAQESATAHDWKVALSEAVQRRGGWSYASAHERTVMDLLDMQADPGMRRRYADEILTGIYERETWLETFRASISVTGGQVTYPVACPTRFVDEVAGRTVDHDTRVKSAEGMTYRAPLVPP